MTEFPEELIILTVGDCTRKVVFGAVERIMVTEPERSIKRPAKEIRFTMDTTMRDLFGQMAATSIKVFSDTIADDPEETWDLEEDPRIAIFYIRTRSTIAALQSEFAKLTEAEELAS